MTKNEEREKRRGRKTNLRLRRFSTADVVPHLIHRLLDHSNRMRSLRVRIHTASRDLSTDLTLEIFEFDCAFFLTDLKFAFLQDLEDDGLAVGCGEGFFEVAVGGDGALRKGGRLVDEGEEGKGSGRANLRDVGKNIIDLDNLRKVGLRSGTVGADGVLVWCVRRKEEKEGKSAAFLRRLIGRTYSKRSMRESSSAKSASIGRREGNAPRTAFHPSSSSRRSRSSTSIAFRVAFRRT